VVVVGGAVVVVVGGAVVVVVLRPSAPSFDDIGLAMRRRALMSDVFVSLPAAST
jgi:hypothetical protein